MLYDPKPAFRHYAKMATDRYIQWIKEGLKRPGKTQAGLAKHLGIAQPQISRMLTYGGRKISVHELPKIAAYLGVPAPNTVPVVGRVLAGDNGPELYALRLDNYM